MVIETLTVPVLQQEKQFLIWVSEEEHNQPVWEYITAQNKFYQTVNKLQN